KNAGEAVMNESGENRRTLVGGLAEARQRLDELELLAAAQQHEYKRLRDQFELFRQLVENSQGLVCSHDLEGNLLYVSPASAMELGYAPADGVARNLRDFPAPPGAPSSDGYLARRCGRRADRGRLGRVAGAGE